jgi:hypothetical protein
MDKMFMSASKIYPWILPTTVGIIHGYFIMSTGPGRRFRPFPKKVRNQEGLVLPSQAMQK